MTVSAADKLRKIVVWLNASLEDANDQFKSIEHIEAAYDAAMTCGWDCWAEDISKEAAEFLIRFISIAEASNREVSREAAQMIHSDFHTRFPGECQCRERA